ncbi:histone-lysine N-methyltransferase ASHH2-like isoform X2 [Impatiens glandulifera]|uniref:histone-lysine N-methyltransferase ASHH2-like isoform X2 n=1 Tax=Impatiens glandulifera TaxID=253017 RepID=UPI001FB158E6|nr:histone-lysine N-methyltransferase ASHH2-like isoform X2 [Impatiens glandulifera]
MITEIAPFVQSFTYMDSNSIFEELAVSLQSCEPFSVAGIDCTIEPDFEDTGFVASLESINIVEHSVLRGDEEKDNTPEIPCSDPRKNVGMSKVNENARLNDKAMRRESKAIKKEPFFNSIFLNVARRRRTYICKPERSSNWGSLDITQLFVDPVDVHESKHTKTQIGKHVAGSRNKKKEGKSSKRSEQYNSASTGPIRLKVRLGNEPDRNFLVQNVEDNVKINRPISKMHVMVPSDLHLPELVGKDGKRDVMLLQADNCNTDDRFPSPEIINNVILFENQHQKRENGQADICGNHDVGFESTDSNVPKELLVYAKGRKNSKSSKSRIVGENLQEVTNSLDKQKGKAFRPKGNNGKPVNKKKPKEEGGHSQDVCKIENDQETGNKSDNLPQVKSRIGNSMEVESKSNMTLQCPSPRIAWVCCDDCLKWRRIESTLADSIEETDCRWTCKESMDKDYADCSVPQEMSNDEINEELEISDVSCGEDPSNGYYSKKSEHKLYTAPQQTAWALIKSNMFLHRTRKSQTIDEIMVCHCKPSRDGKRGCGDGCLNRMLNIECVQGTCPCEELCSNQLFQKRNYAKLNWFRCGKKGYGLQVVEDIREGQFLIEYVGEVLDMHAHEARQREYAANGHKHFYFMTLNGSEVIDACAKGNLGRFINHSCEPNCRTEKWMVNGEVCIGLFAVRDINKGEEVTFDYNYVRVFGAAAKKCVCGSSLCRGYIGGDRSNDELIVQDDSDEEYPEPLMVYKEDDIDDDLRNLLSINYSFDDVETHAINIKPEVDSVRPNNLLEEIVISGPRNLKTLSEDKDESLEVVGKAHTSNTSVQLSSENSVEKFSESAELSELLPQIDKSQTITKNTQQDLSGQRLSNHPVHIQNSDTSSLTVKGESFSEARDIVKKCKADVALNLQAKTKTSRPCSAVKKEKVKASRNLDKPHMVDNKSHVPPFKTNKMMTNSSNSRFEAVEEKLNELLDSEGGISKRNDSTKGYLKLLLLTAASGYCGSGEATIQSNRDLSMILDALLKTKSRMVLVDIINKNGLQMLHNIMKKYRREFNKTPILRKLLKVLEYLAIREILGLEQINGGPPCPGVESFRVSMLSLTEHADKQVHQIARNFRDKWIQKSIRKISSMNNHHRGSNNCNKYLRRSGWDVRTPPEVPPDNNNKKKVPTVPSSSSTVGVSCSSSTCPPPSGTTRIRKRKSRWDERGDIEDPSPQTPQNPSAAVNMDLDTLHPGFSSPFVRAYPKGKFNSRIPVSYGIPLPIVQQFGYHQTQTERPSSWIIAPGIPFHSFPPLPPLCPSNMRDHHPLCTISQPHQQPPIALKTQGNS